MSKIFWNFILIASLMAVPGACSRNKYNGVYVGTLTRETQTIAIDKSVSGKTVEDEENLLVQVKQEGDDVYLTISGSRLLGDCRLQAKLSKNGAAYIDTPQTCSESMSLQGSMNKGGEDLLFSLNGYGQTTNQNYRFRGLKK
jgi:hypothetical protein